MRPELTKIIDWKMTWWVWKIERQNCQIIKLLKNYIIANKRKGDRDVKIKRTSMKVRYRRRKMNNRRTRENKFANLNGKRNNS